MMSILLVFTSLMWIAIYAYPWIDWATGHKSKVEVWLWLKFENYVERNNLYSFLVPVDWEQFNNRNRNV